MEGNSRLPGVATEPRFRARAIEHEVLGDLDAAIAWARDACELGQSTETLLPAMLWAIEKAATQLAPLERHLHLVDFINLEAYQASVARIFGVPIELLS